MSDMMNIILKDFQQRRINRAQREANTYNNGQLKSSQKAYIQGNLQKVISNKTYGYQQNGLPEDTWFTGGRSKKNYKDIQEGKNPYQAKYFKPSIKSSFYVEPYVDKEGNKGGGFYSNKRRLENNEVLARRLYGNNVTPTTLARAGETKDRLNNYSIMRSYNANSKTFKDTLNTPKLDGLRVARNKGGGLNYLIGGTKDFLLDPVVDVLKGLDVIDSGAVNAFLGGLEILKDINDASARDMSWDDVRWGQIKKRWDESIDESNRTGWGKFAGDTLNEIQDETHRRMLEKAKREGNYDEVKSKIDKDLKHRDSLNMIAGLGLHIVSPIQTGGAISKVFKKVRRTGSTVGIISDPEIYETFSRLADRIQGTSKKSGLNMDLQTLAKNPKTQETAEFLGEVSGVKVKQSKKSANLYKFKDYDDTISAIERVRNDETLVSKILDNIDDENIEDDVFDYLGEKYPDMLERYLGGESKYVDELTEVDTTNSLNDLIDAHKNKQIDYVDENGNVVETLNKNSKSIEYNKWVYNIRNIAHKNQSRQSSLKLPERINTFNTYIDRYSRTIFNPQYISKTGITRYDDTIKELTKLKRANISATEKVRYLNEILFKGESVISPSISKQTVKNILDIFIDINKSAKGVVSGKPIEELSNQTLNYLKRVYKTKELPTEINSQTILFDLKKMAENYSKSYVDKSYWDKLKYLDEVLGKNAVSKAFSRMKQIRSSGKVSPELTKELQDLQNLIDKSKNLKADIDDLDDFDEYLKINNEKFYNKLIGEREAREKELAGKQSRNNIINKVLDELDEDSSFKKVGRDDTPESILKSIQEEYSIEGSPVKFLDSYDDVVKYHNYKAKPLQYEADMKYQQRLLNYNGDDINSYKGNEEFLLNSQEIQEMLNYEKLMKERAPRINNHIDANGEYIRFSTKQAMEHPDVQHNIINYIQSLEREIKELLSNNSVGKLGYKSNRHTSAQNDYLDALSSFNNTMVTFKNSDFYSYRKDILNNIFKEYPNLKSSVGDTDFYKYVNIVAKDKYVRDLISKYSSLCDTLINHFPNLNLKNSVGDISYYNSKIFDMLSKEKKIAGEILANSKKIQNKSYKLQNMLKITSPKFSKAGSDIIPANVEFNKKNLWKIVVNEVDMAKKNPELYKEYKDAFSYLRKQYFGGLKTQRISESELENITNIVNEKLKEIPTIKERNEELVKDVFSKLKNKSNIPIDLQLLARKPMKDIKKLEGDELRKYSLHLQSRNLNEETIYELKVICKQLGITGYSKLNKNELINIVSGKIKPVVENNNLLDRAKQLRTENLSSKSIDELKSICKELGIKGYENKSHKKLMYDIDDKLSTIITGKKHDKIEYRKNNPLEDISNKIKQEEVVTNVDTNLSAEDINKQIDILNRKFIDARKQGMLNIGNSKQHEYYKLADDYAKQIDDLKKQLKSVTKNIETPKVEEKVTPITKLDDKVNSNKLPDGSSKDDELYTSVLDYVKSDKTTSVANLQRKFNITSGKAQKILNSLEERGVIKKGEKGKPYEVIFSSKGDDVVSPTKNVKTPKVEEKVTPITKLDDKVKNKDISINTPLSVFRGVQDLPAPKPYSSKILELNRNNNELIYDNMKKSFKNQSFILSERINEHFRNLDSLQDLRKDVKEFTKIGNFNSHLLNLDKKSIEGVIDKVTSIRKKANDLKEKFPGYKEVEEIYDIYNKYFWDAINYRDGVLGKGDHPLDSYNPSEQLDILVGRRNVIIGKIKGLFEYAKGDGDSINKSLIDEQYIEKLYSEWSNINKEISKLQEFVDGEHMFEHPTELKEGYRHIDRDYNTPDVDPYLYRYDDNDNRLYDDALEVINKRDDVPVDYDYYDSRGVDYVPENFIDPDNPNIIYVHDKFGRRKPIYKSEGTTPEEIMVDKYNKLYPDKPYLQNLIDTGRENLLRDKSADRKLPWEIERTFDNRTKNVIIDTNTGEIRPTKEALKLNAINKGRLKDFENGKDITTPADYWIYDYKQANAFVDYMRNKQKMRGEDFTHLLSEFNMFVDKDSFDKKTLFNDVKKARRELTFIQDKHPDVIYMPDSQYINFVKDNYGITIYKNAFRTVEEAQNRLFYFVDGLHKKGLVDIDKNGEFTLTPFADELVKSDVFLENPLNRYFEPSPFSAKREYYDYMDGINEIEDKYKGSDDIEGMYDAIDEYKMKWKMKKEGKDVEDIPKDVPKDKPKDVPKPPKDAPKPPKDVPKDKPKDVPKDKPKDVPKSPKDKPKDKQKNKPRSNSKSDNILSKLLSKLNDKKDGLFDFINPPVDGEKSWYENSAIFDPYKRWLNTYKRGVTLYNPGWHLANFFQNKAQNYYGLGNDAFKSQKKASKMLDAIQGKSSELPDIMTKNGVKIEADKVMDYAVNNGIVDGLYKDIKSAPRTIFPNLDKRIDETPLMQLLARNEQTARLHHFITQIENGMSFEDAHKSVNKYLFDYSKKGEADKFIENFIDPFWTFHKNSARLAGEASLRNPHRMGNVLRAERGMQNGVDEEERNNNASETNYQLPYGSYNDTENGDRYDMMYKQNMFITPTNTFPGDFASIEGKMNPLLKLAIQQYRGKGNWNTDVVDGEPGFDEISRDEKKKEVVANINPVLNNFFTNLNKSKTYEEREQSQETIDKQKMMLWLNYITGGKFNYQRNIDWL